jgi:hypothetical protein
MILTSVAGFMGPIIPPKGVLRAIDFLPGLLS